MQQLWKLVLPAGLGLIVASLTRVTGLEDSTWYLGVISALLAVGLYGSTHAIDVRHARRDVRTILAAVTIGVVIKAAIIGVILALAWRDPLFLVLGVAVAQIDPLAVASILDNPRMSARAKSILASWSSFDDPITVILVIYAAALVARETNVDGTYLKDAIINVVFLGVAWALWRLVRRWPAAVTVLALILIGVAAWQHAFLGLAVAGLFIRPDFGKQLSWAVQAALVGASFMLGLLLFEGVELTKGASLGVLAFASQIIVGFLLTRRLPMDDRVHLALAQQNGITAIILALLLQAQFHDAVAIVAPAILVVNVIHALANAYLDRKRRA